MVQALRRLTDVEFLSWKRPYPPFLYRGPVRDDLSRPPHAETADFVLDWSDPRTWGRAIRRAEAFEADAIVVPWLHPVMFPQYAWLLRASRGRFRRIVVCHNVLPHERVPLARALTRNVLRRADTLVTHAPAQRDELLELGARGDIVEAFHPLFVPADLAAKPSSREVEAERARCGNPELLVLLYGAVRPYKGVDLALEALARVDRALDIRVVVAGRFWTPLEELESLACRLGVDHRVEFRDRYLSNEETTLLFEACDAALLPYRSATQSGVAALALGHGRPVVATAVGGLSTAVDHGADGLLSPPDDPTALARAIEELARDRIRLRRGAERIRSERSFDAYAELIVAAATRGRAK